MGNCDKNKLGKLELKTPFSEISQQIEYNGFQILLITFEDTLILSTLPFHHIDPFDKIIVSQSFNNKLTVISRETNFEAYQVVLKW